MRAAFLVRCSTNKQDYERQIEDLKYVALDFKFKVEDSLIFGEYITGKDDTTQGDRISIRNLKKAAKEGLFDVILISEVSRLSRDSVSGRVYIREFCNYGIPVYFRDKGRWTIDLKTKLQNEDFIKELGFYFDGAAEYLKSMKTQVASGRRNALRNNQLILGHVPFGYKKQGGTNKRTKSTILVSEEEANVVRFIFDTYLKEGSSMKTVALAASALYGKKRFTVSSIQQTLNSPAYYTGELTVNMKDPDDKTKAAEPFTVTFEPIIDEETFNKATQKRKDKRNARQPYPKQQVFPLSRLIKCPDCGYAFSPYRRASDKPNETYRTINGEFCYSWKCCSRINNQSDCKCCVNLNNHKVEKIIWELIKKELIGFATLGLYEKEEKIDELTDDIEDMQQEIDLQEKQKHKLEKNIDKAYAAFDVAVDLDPERAKKKLASTLADIQKDLDSANNRIQVLKDKIEDNEALINHYNRQDYEEQTIKEAETDPSKKRKLFVELIKKVVPYHVKYRVVVLEVYTFEDVFYVLLDGNQRNHKIAHYVNMKHAVWQNSKNRYEGHEAGDYFLIPNASLFIDTEDLEVFATFTEMQKYCTKNKQTIDYEYE